MSSCLNCVELKAESERLKAENEQEKQLNAELLAQIEQLSAAVAFDPDHVFVDLSERFDDQHIGQPNEEEREQELIGQLAAFSTLFKNGKLI